MNVKERIFSVVLEEKIKKNPGYAKKIGIEILEKEAKEKRNKNEKLKGRN